MKVRLVQPSVKASSVGGEFADRKGSGRPFFHRAQLANADLMGYGSGRSGPARGISWPMPSPSQPPRSRPHRSPPPSGKPGRSEPASCDARKRFAAACGPRYRRSRPHPLCGGRLGAGDPRPRKSYRRRSLEHERERRRAADSQGCPSAASRMASISESPVTSHLPRRKRTFRARRGDYALVRRPCGPPDQGSPDFRRRDPHSSITTGGCGE
jgi:hypothetical protein